MSLSTALEGGYQFARAGRYGPEAVLDARGNALVGALVSVYYSDGSTLATLWDDETRLQTVANPTNVGGDGNLWFWADPGEYVIDVSGVGQFEIFIQPHPEDLADVDAHGHDGDYVAGGVGVDAVVRLTQAQFDALPSKNATTLYAIVG